LKSRKILRAGLDVFATEPDINPAFLALDNVTLVPHIGSASVHTRGRMGQLVVDNLVAFANGKPPLTPVPETPFQGWGDGGHGAGRRHPGRGLFRRLSCARHRRLPRP